LPEFFSNSIDRVRKWVRVWLACGHDLLIRLQGSCGSDWTTHYGLPAGRQPAVGPQGGHAQARMPILQFKRLGCSAKRRGDCLASHDTDQMSTICGRRMQIRVQVVGGYPNVADGIFRKIARQSLL